MTLGARVAQALSRPRVPAPRDPLLKALEIGCEPRNTLGDFSDGDWVPSRLSFLGPDRGVIFALSILDTGVNVSSLGER